MIASRAGGGNGGEQFVPAPGIAGHLNPGRPVPRFARVAGATPLVAAALALSVAGAGAQIVPQTVLPEPAIADSIRLIDSLGRVVRANPKNAGAWLRQGQTALRLAEIAARQAMPKGFDEPRMFRLAHESINRAFELDPENAQVFIALARLKATAGGVQGPSTIDLQYEAFRRASTRQDSSDFAGLAYRMGRGAFGEYEFLAEKALGSLGETGDAAFPTEALIGQRGSAPPDYTMGPAGPVRTARAAAETAAGGIPPVVEVSSVMAASGNDILQSLPIILYAARDSVLSTMAQLPFDAAGERQYTQADLWLERAHDANPTDQAIYLEYAKVLVTRGRWSELLGIATTRIARAADDPWGWMALGLAQQRLRLTREARAAFDTALARFGAEERARIDRLERVLRNGDAVAFRNTDSAGRARNTYSSWLLADPLWSSDEEEPRTEFLARVAFSELRWTYGSVRGADSPRGDIYTRYGPPDTIIGPFWIYDSGLMFALTKGPISRIAAGDAGIVARIREWQPSRWDNIAESRIDSMPIQVARFRGGTDSVEVFIAIDAPLDSLRAGAGVTTPVRTDFWLYGWTVPEAYRDSTTLTEDAARRWVYRVPSGAYYYRIESTVPGSRVAARAAASAQFGPDTASGFTVRGFGMSDLLLATNADAPANAGRWRDVTFTPLTADVRVGGALAIVWETYELARADSEARYTVTVTMERERSTGARIAANIASRLATLVGVERAENRLTVRFDRNVPHAVTVTDLLNIELGETQAGSYRLTVEVTDRVSGAVTSRVTRVVLY